MYAEFRIIEFRRGHVLAQPLDAIKQEALRFANASKYIENEIIAAQPVSSSPGDLSRWEVIASRIEPSFIDGEIPKLAPSGGDDEEFEYEFTDYVSYEDGEDFQDALETLRSGDYNTAAQLLRAFIKRFPYHIDSYHHLGIIETDLGRRARGLRRRALRSHLERHPPSGGPNRVLGVLSHPPSRARLELRDVSATGGRKGWGSDRAPFASA
jgi:hypothetical protein